MGVDFLIAGTRGSSLALVQTKYIIRELSKITDEDIETKIIKTTGDKITNSQLYKIDVKGIFTKELDRAVLEEEVDFAVHSLKDLPTEMAEDLKIIAIPPRESPREALVSPFSWDEIPENAKLGTSSLRRESFCRYHKKKLKIAPIRGNVDTRIRKVSSGEYDATIMAEAGLKRLGLNSHIKQIFPTTYFTPAAGQGALAIVAREDSIKKDILTKLNHKPSYLEVQSEKKVLEELGVGCQWPLGVNAKIEKNHLHLTGVLLDKEGNMLSKVNLTGKPSEANQIGKKAAKRMKEDYQ